jgi:hypothetical protein
MNEIGGELHPLPQPEPNAEFRLIAGKPADYTSTIVFRNANIFDFSVGCQGLPVTDLATGKGCVLVSGAESVSAPAP